MMIVRILLATLAWLAAFGGVPARAANPVAAPPSERAAIDPALVRVVDVVNVHRRAKRLVLVRLNAILTKEAQRFSGVQARLGRLSHRGDDNTTGGQRLTRAGYRWSFWGENLAAGQERVDQVVAAWMASPPHRALLLHPQAREIGLGHTFRPNDPSGFFDYWVLELGRPR